MVNLSRLRLPAIDTSRKLFRAACERYDLVYFGAVSQRSDEHQLVRGFTMSPRHVDRHYCVGTVSSHDVILFQRTNTLSFPDKPSKAYTWTILQVDLRARQPAHVLLNGHRYDAMVYNDIFAKFQGYCQYTEQMFAGHDPLFLQSFRVFGAPQYIDHILSMLPLATTSVLAHHFRTFDYEVYGDRLIVYHAGSSPTEATLEMMFRAGIWLAQQLDPMPAQLSEPQRGGSTLHEL